jgi:hypothetical protein
VTYGKYNSGDVKSGDYISFSCDGRAYPTRHGIGKSAYSFYTLQGASQYEPTIITYHSAEERDAYLAYYRQQGFNLTSTRELSYGPNLTGDLVLRAPKPVWLSNGSAKPAVLKSVVQMVAAYPGSPADAVRYAFSQNGGGNSGYAGMIPRLISLGTYGELQRAINDTRQAHGGELDLDDMRIWAMLFGPENHQTRYRADLCDDPNVATTPFQR